jgi:hypothetical protein
MFPFLKKFFGEAAENTFFPEHGRKLTDKLSAVPLLF